MATKTVYTNVKTFVTVTIEEIEEMLIAKYGISEISVPEVEFEYSSESGRLIGASICSEQQDSPEVSTME